jgi:phosphoglycerate kinase
LGDFDLRQVEKADDSIGDEVEKKVALLKDGDVLLLENVRFYKEEEKNDPEHAKKLASVADLYVNDAFGTAHRAHASTEGVTKYLSPCVAGFLLQKVRNPPLDCLWILSALSHLSPWILQL